MIKTNQTFCFIKVIMLYLTCQWIFYVVEKFNFLPLYLLFLVDRGRYSKLNLKFEFLSYKNGRNVLIEILQIVLASSNGLFLTPVIEGNIFNFALCFSSPCIKYGPVNIFVTEGYYYKQILDSGFRKFVG